MLLNHEKPESEYQVNGYRPGVVTINHQDYAHSVLLSTSQLLPWPLAQLDQLEAEHLAPLHTWKCQLLLLGCGDEPFCPSASLLETLKHSQIPFELMQNNAACRTFMGLINESRKLCLGLILPEISLTSLSK